MASLGSMAKIIRTPEQSGQMAKASQTHPATPASQDKMYQDQFLSLDELIAPKSDFSKKSRGKTLDDIRELMGKNQWENILALYYPVEDKVPDLVAAGMDIPVREKIAFALGQVGRFDDAIAELLVCTRKEPDNFFARSSLAYTAYNSLYANKNKEIFLTPDLKAKRLALAHDSLKKAQELRPDGVTNFYRQGMLISQIENKPEQALPLFLRACQNWEGLSPADQEARHQEKKNYIKSLYRLASLLLSAGNGDVALERIKICLSLDEKSNHISLPLKYFALGKVYFHLGKTIEARDALMFAHQSRGSRPGDFVVELLARTFLALGKKERAMEVLNTIPEQARRPYFRWTEADALCAMNKFSEAQQVLKKSMARDNRSRHKTLIKLAKICYLQKNFSETEKYAVDADHFFQNQWNNPYGEGMFWTALAQCRQGRTRQALETAEKLKAHFRFFPRLDQLITFIKEQTE